MPRAAGQRELSIPAERYYNQSNDGSAPGQSRSLVGRGYRGRRGWYSDPNIPGQNSYESSGDRFAQRQANFKIGLQVIDPVSDSFPPANTGYYVVRDGDTLESIAQAAYGDSSYANLIGEANAKNDDTLKVGDRLVLPTMFQSRFKSSTGEPYELLKQQIVANLYPILDVPQPPDNDDDSIFDAIVDIIIVVVAVVVSGGNPLLAAAIAAETEAEVEAVEVALGMRNSFSLKHVAQIAVEAGFAAGTGDVLSSLGKGITIPEEVATIGASAVTEQLTEMKLGLRDHFDLQAVLEQMAEAGITAEIAPSVNTAGTAADQGGDVLVNNVASPENVLVNMVVSGVVEGVFEGQLSPQMLENLAANALGTEVGDAIGNDIDPPRQETTVPTSSSQQTVPQPNIFERVLHEAEAEIESLVDDIKDLFDPTVVAPNAQKPAASIAKKMSQQGMFARKLAQEREADDGIDLRLNPNAGMGKPDPAQLGKGLNLSDSTSGSSGVSKTPTTKSDLTDEEVYGHEFVGAAYGMRNTLVYPVVHPINMVEGVADLVLQNEGILATALPGGAVGFISPSIIEQELNADEAGIQGAINNFSSAIHSGNPYVRGYAWGSIFGGAAATVIDPAAVSMTAEGVEVGSAWAVFRKSVDPAGSMVRRSMMLEENTGYNITPKAAFNEFPMIGNNGQLYITDYQSISSALGNIQPNAEYSVGLFSSANQVSFFAARKLEMGLGLTRGSLDQGFKFSEIGGIREMNPRPPLAGNKYYTGAGMGLWNGGPELVIDPLPSNLWPWRNSR